MKSKRRFTTFSLSFLDIMSCGLGAVALVFLIVKHDVDNSIKQNNQTLQSEVQLIEEDVAIGTEGLIQARNILSDIDQKLLEANGAAKRITDEIKNQKTQLTELQKQQVSTKVLQQKVATLTSQRDLLLKQQQKDGNKSREFIGQGNRQYLTGMKMDGERIIILLDASTSMLDERLVNIIRRRNMNDISKRQAPKWRQAVKTVEWLTAQLPQQSQYQLFSFNTNTVAVLKKTDKTWLNVSDRDELNKTIAALQQLTPEGGTSLQRAFMQVQQMSPRPDNIFLITDGLPTQGLKKPRAKNISGRDRVALFNQALSTLPSNIPVNVILLPMEGDPLAAAAFWQLAQRNQGSFLSPAEDWP